MAHARTLWQTVRRTLIAIAALVVAYFAFPVHDRDGAVAVVIGAAVTVVALGILLVAIRRLLRRQHDEPDAPIGGLAVAVVGGVLLSALIDYAIAYHLPGEFSGLDTRVDGLYYVVSTLLTVGFGDIYAHGQIARGVLILQMVFNIVVLTTTATIFAKELRRRANRN
ncbi:potassium channel family protein [Stackebrandtia soli]|uniref:potassium channel family protein n=1 Tax=Stackebrandtia soli TaxID=1892856 RepID=UPI0039EBB4A9